MRSASKIFLFRRKNKVKRLSLDELIPIIVQFRWFAIILSLQHFLRVIIDLLLGARQF